jgi:hypothetical protein
MNLSEGECGFKKRFLLNHFVPFVSFCGKISARNRLFKPTK